MYSTASPPPIPGETIDPPPKDAPDRIKEIDEKSGAVSTAVGSGYRAFMRFSHSLATLLAAGTAYYLFLAMFSIIALAYGVVTTIGADNVATYLTDALQEAFPGLLGEDGVDPERLRQIGQATSIVGAIGILYGGTGSVLAAVKAVHQIYGAPNDSRNFVLARVRALGWLILLGLLILTTFAMASLTADVTATIFDALGIEQWPSLLINAGSLVLTLAVNWLIIYLILSHFGGIRPDRRSRVIGASIGSVVTAVVQQLLGLLISFTIDKPEYGAAAAPIGILFVLYLLTLATYAAASITAGVAARNRTLGDQPGAAGQTVDD